MRRLLLAVGVLAISASATPVASAKPTLSKSLYGPLTTKNNVTAFLTYSRMDVGIYHYNLRWNEVAASRPSRAPDPKDRAYVWPDELDYAISEAEDYGIRISVTVSGTPRWANGGAEPGVSPRRASDVADFFEALSRRYKGINYFVVWHEPNYIGNWRPQIAEHRFQNLGPIAQRAPRRYARAVDAIYSRIKRIDRNDMVIAGNTGSTGDISPRNWIKWMVLPGNRPPRYDMYGHHPMSTRQPSFGVFPPLGGGFADFADTPSLARWLDLYQSRPGRGPLKIWFGRFRIPGGGHRSNGFGDLVLSNEEHARWVRLAYQNVANSKRVFTLGYDQFFDEAPNAEGTHFEGGLFDATGEPKPAVIAAYRGL